MIPKYIYAMEQSQNNEVEMPSNATLHSKNTAPLTKTK